MSDVGDLLMFLGLTTLSAALLFFVPLWGPSIVFRRAGELSLRGVTRPTFFLADAFVLVVFLSFASSLVSFVRGEMSLPWFVCLMIAANGLAALIWLRGLRFMQQHAIESPLQRLLFQAVLYPLSVLAPAATLANTMFLLSAIAVRTKSLETAAAGVLILSLLITLITRRLYLRYFVDEPPSPSTSSEI